MSVPGSGGCSMISVAILEDGCKPTTVGFYSYLSCHCRFWLHAAPFKDQGIQFFFFYSCNFLVVGLVVEICADLCIAINRRIILLKSGNQNINFLFNHLQFLKILQLLLRPPSTIILIWKPNTTNFWSIMYFGCELFIALTYTKEV